MSYETGFCDDCGSTLIVEDVDEKLCEPCNSLWVDETSPFYAEVLRRIQQDDGTRIPLSDIL